MTSGEHRDDDKVGAALVELALYLAGQEIDWWRAHHMHDYEGQRSAIANQLARLHGLSVDDALLAAHCMIVAGGLHDVAENCNEPSMRDEAKKWMARYCEIILTKSNPARAAIEEEGGRAAQVSDRHPRVI